jgi:hypothetical protein
MSMRNDLGRRLTAVVGLALAGGLLAAGVAGPAMVAASSAPACSASQLSAVIITWSGATGSEIANVRIANTSFHTCDLRDYPRVELLSGHGVVMLQGTPASGTAPIHVLHPLGVLKTQVRDANYCGPAYAAPVTLAFVLPGTAGRVVAMPPLDSTSLSGVPPCNGAPGSAGTITMHVWHT